MMPDLLKQPDSFVANEIIKELRDLCTDKGITGHSELATFLVNLLSLDPGYGLRGKTITRSDIDRIITKCLQIVSDPVSPQTITLQMQCLAEENSLAEMSIVDGYKRAMERQTSQITREIVDFDAKTKDEAEKLRRIIAIDVILNTGDLDGATPDDKAIEETVTAIGSVMGDTDLIKFCKLSVPAKLESLKEIRSIVCGIRIFNEDAGITNTAIPNLPKTLLQSNESTASVLQIALSEVMDNVNLLTSAFYACTTISARDKTFALTYPATIDADSVDYMKDLLIMYRQQERILRKLLGDMPRVKVEIEKSILKHRERLAQLHKVLEYRTAVATNNVFPKFIKLFETWKGLQNYVYVLAEINRLNGALLKLTECIPSFDMAALQMLQAGMIETDEERMQRTGGTRRLKSAANVECLVVDCEAGTQMEFLGFCAYTMCEAGGLLLPANPGVGLCERNGKFYAFNSVEAGDLFMELPKRYEFAMAQLVRDKIQLISLLDAFATLEHQSTESLTRPEFAAGMCEAEVQTELHPIPFYQDKDYVWNVWDLRRKAIQLTNLVDCRTRSAQTVMSYGTEAANIQADPPRQRPGQTQKEAHTLTVNVAGLRKDSQHEMDLCRSNALTDTLKDMKI